MPMGCEEIEDDDNENEEDQATSDDGGDTVATRCFFPSFIASRFYILLLFLCINVYSWSRSCCQTDTFVVFPLNNTEITTLCLRTFIFRHQPVDYNNFVGII